MRISAKHRQQVLRGLRLAGNLLLGFVTLVLVLDGAHALTGGEAGRFGKIGDFIAPFAGFWILFAKADHWKTWVAGFFGLPGLLNGLGILITGHMAKYPYTPVPRNEALMAIIFAILLITAMYPSAQFQTPCGPLGRALFSAAVVSSSWL